MEGVCFLIVTWARCLLARYRMRMRGTYYIVTIMTIAFAKLALVWETRKGGGAAEKAALLLAPEVNFKEAALRIATSSIRAPLLSARANHANVHDVCAQLKAW